eukprot:3008534-Alexandrium_andersonii.AAC.1
MSASLVGSEMCIRDSASSGSRSGWPPDPPRRHRQDRLRSRRSGGLPLSLIHTDAADDMQCVDLG